ncbi:hypothetical protein IJG73_02115 [Candidatus Saccharibacteria bacterium]|nr:hypothetical protein [Candidatus Saccharibacteria bacterium]
MQKIKFNIITTAIIFAVAFCIFFTVSPIVLADSSATDLSITLDPVISIRVMKNNVDTDNLTLNVDPTASGRFIKDDLSVVVSTSNDTGYTLTFANNDTDNSMHHADSSITTTIPSITTATDEANFPVNSWGYSLGDITSSAQQFSSIPLSTATTTIKTTTTPIAEDSTNVTFAAKVDTSIPAGVYSDTVVFTATTNYVPPAVYEFDYSGAEQNFTAPKSGTYRVEMWGAGIFGGGSYTAGDIFLSQGTSVSLYLGQMSQGCTPYTACSGRSYNGGGSGAFFTQTNAPIRYYGGGGSTDIRLVGGQWDSEPSLKSRIMVAAGAGVQGRTNDTPVAGGGLHGYTTNAYNNGGAGTQTSGGAAGGAGATAGGFGYGGDSTTASPGCLNYNNALGASSGYYGGGGARSGACTTGTLVTAYGGTGSSFISGHAGSVAIESATSLTPRLDSNGIRCVDGTTDIVCSHHYSNKIFTNTVMIDGAGYNWTTVKGDQKPMPNPTGGYYALGQGHTGNGYAKITGPL